VTIAYVMLNCELGAEAEIAENLKRLDNVVDVYETIGAHDMLVRLETENFEKVREIITWNIKNMAKVRSTVTLVRKE